MKLQEIMKVLAHRQEKIATAESCTGGLLAAKITDISGASAVFDMGLVSYSNAVKHRYLGVPDAVLERYGAVSGQTAQAMAEGIVAASGADYGVGITGIAGPSGGTEEKPVGLVYFAVCDHKNRKTEVQELHLHGTREQIREQTCQKVIDFLYEWILGNN